MCVCVCVLFCVFVLQFPPTNFAFRIILIIIAHSSQNNSRLFLLRLIVVCVVFIVFLGMVQVLSVGTCLVCV